MAKPSEALIEVAREIVHSFVRAPDVQDSQEPDRIKDLVEQFVPTIGIRLGREGSGSLRQPMLLLFTLFRGFSPVESIIPLWRHWRKLSPKRTGKNQS